MLQTKGSAAEQAKLVRAAQHTPVNTPVFVARPILSPRMGHPVLQRTRTDRGWKGEAKLAHIRHSRLPWVAADPMNTRGGGSSWHCGAHTPCLALGLPKHGLLGYTEDTEGAGAVREKHNCSGF